MRARLPSALIVAQNPPAVQGAAAAGRISSKTRRDAFNPDCSSKTGAIAG
ncbi:MAG: hypothetical protein HPY72_04525 [Anaerolineae bacterium]|nr:hypothetical protein [Anaerolineae bacterium]